MTGNKYHFFGSAFALTTLAGLSVLFLTPLVELLFDYQLLSPKAMAFLFLCSVVSYLMIGIVVGLEKSNSGKKLENELPKGSNYRFFILAIIFFLIPAALWVWIVLGWWKLAVLMLVILVVMSVIAVATCSLPLIKCDKE